MPDHDFAQVTTTHEEQAAAARIALEVVRRRLAACVQTDQVSSYYWWEGEVQWAPEYRVTMKTTKASVPALLEAVRELHSYVTPEIIATPITGGDADYLEWIAAEVRSMAG